jgi:hypothetical protein
MSNALWPEDYLTWAVRPKVIGMGAWQVHGQRHGCLCSVLAPGMTPNFIAHALNRLHVLSRMYPSAVKVGSVSHPSSIWYLHKGNIIVFHKHKRRGRSAR